MLSIILKLDPILKAITVRIVQMVFAAIWLLYVHPTGVLLSILYLWALVTILSIIEFCVSLLIAWYFRPKLKKRGQHVSKFDLQPDFDLKEYVKQFTETQKN